MAASGLVTHSCQQADKNTDNRVFGLEHNQLIRLRQHVHRSRTDRGSQKPTYHHTSPAPFEGNLNYDSQSLGTCRIWKEARGQDLADTYQGLHSRCAEHSTRIKGPLSRINSSVCQAPLVNCFYTHTKVSVALEHLVSASGIVQVHSYTNH
jgi:hypothetical protein